MKNFFKGFLPLAVAFVALSASSVAQNVQFNGIGSSAMFLELGQAATTSGIGATCVWSTNVGSTVFASDNSANGGGTTETGNAWVAWTPNGTDCASVNGSTNIYAYLQTDSVVGDRCLFNGCTVNYTNGSGVASSGLILGTSGEVPLPAAVVAALTSASTVNAAGTDIRPEDAEFAITRATTACGTPVAQFPGVVSLTNPATQYLGLGYNNRDTINSFYSASTFNVIKFALPSSFTVTPIGAVPVVVAVHGNGLPTGFSNSNITNLNRSTLALYLDGSIGSTADAMTPGTTGATALATVIVREPLSGTYNTMEYNVPNTVALQTSQDVGSNQLAFQANCNLTSPAMNPMHIANAAGSFRNRAIGTGQELSEVFSIANSLGYGFWSVSNFKGATANSKYLTIDGVDPLQTTYSDGTIPTASNGSLGNVNFAHVVDGTYPIWSLLRLVTTNSSASSVASALATAAGTFVANSSQPDFVPFGKLAVERSHFTPPGIYVSGSAPTPQNGVGGASTEVGGDVGGVVIPVRVDADYLTDTGSTFTGRRS